MVSSNQTTYIHYLLHIRYDVTLTVYAVFRLMALAHTHVSAYIQYVAFVGNGIQSSFLGSACNVCLVRRTVKTTTTKATKQKWAD